MRLQTQLARVKDKEEDIVVTKWHNISKLELEELSKDNGAPSDFLFNVVSEKFNLPSIDQSVFADSLVNLSVTGLEVPSSKRISTSSSTGSQK